MNVLVTLLLIVVILGIAFWIVGLIPLPPTVEPFRNVVLAIVGVIALLYLLGVLMGVTGIPTLRVT